MERLRLSIDGMSCGHCVDAVTKALEAVPGVTVEQVAIGSATLRFDPARVSSDAVIDAVNDQGYLAHRAGAA